MLVEILIAGILIFTIMTILKLGYQNIVNATIREFGGTLEKIDTNILDINSNNVIALYILIVAVIYIANTVYQKIVSNKLNRELNKK